MSDIIEGGRRIREDVLDGHPALQTAFDRAMAETDGDVFAVAAGLYWYCVDYSEWMGARPSPEYAIMGALDYHPGAGEPSPGSEDFDAEGECANDKIAYDIFEAARQEAR